MMARGFWAAVGFQAPVKISLRLFLWGGLFITHVMCAEALASESSSSFVVNELVQKLVTVAQIPQSVLQAKAEKFFSPLNIQTSSSDFHSLCAAFVKECAQEKAVYLQPHPQNEALNTARPTVRFLEGQVAYLYLPAPEVHSNQKKAYIRFIRKIIRRMSRRPLKGWVLDLRDCEGYDVKTLLAACIDLFQEGPLSFIESEKGSFYSTLSKEGATLFIGTQPLESGGRLPYRPLLFPKKIAVLQGEGTRGAGEALVLSLKSQEATKTFGKPTQGQLRYYEPTPLQSGGYLLIQTSQFVGTEKKRFSKGLPPDIPINCYSTETDITLNTALMWVLDIS